MPLAAAENINALALSTLRPALSRQEKLRYLGSFKHPIVANNTGLPMPQGLKFFRLVKMIDDLATF